MAQTTANATLSSLKIKVFASKCWHRINDPRTKRNTFQCILQAPLFSFCYCFCHHTCLTNAVFTAKFVFEVLRESAGCEIFSFHYFLQMLLATNSMNFTSKQKGYKHKNFNANSAYALALNTIQHSWSLSTLQMPATVLSQAQRFWTHPAELYRDHSHECWVPATGEKERLSPTHQ